MRGTASGGAGGGRRRREELADRGGEGADRGRR